MLTQTGIENGLRKLGLGPGDAVKVHKDLYYLDYGGTPDDAWQKVQDEAERSGLIRRHRIGNAECMLFRARAIVQIYVDGLRSDPFGLFGVKTAARLA